MACMLTSATLAVERAAFAGSADSWLTNSIGSRKPTRCKESEPQNPQDPGDDKNGPVPETPPGERKSPFLQGSIHQESTGAVSRSTEHTSPLKTARYRTEPEDTVQQRYTPPSSNTASNTLERRQSKRRKLSHGSETGTSTALVSPSHSDDTVNPKVSSGGGEAHRSNTDEGAQRECLQPTRPHPIASPPAKRKVLRLNQNGTLLSPPKEKATQDSQLATPDKQDAKPRGRRKRRPQLLVIIRYGTSDETRRREVGEAIDKLCGMSTEQPKAPSTTRALHPSKPTHPFFSGKARNEDVTEASRASQPATREPERVAASPSKIKAFTTPVKMRQATTVAQAPVESLPLFSRGSSGSKKPTMSGLYEPCWPWRGSNHVRPSSAEPSSKALMGNTALFHRRRRKDKPEWINKKNEVLSSDLGVVKNVIENSTPDLKHGSDVSAKASVPRRSVESRQTLRSKTITALDVCLRVKGSITCNALLHKHPALKSVYDRIGRTLSAFDHGECESRTWSQMYAPKRAKHVLQTQDETNLLRAWLARSTVDSVEMKLAEVGAPRPSILRQSSEDKLQKAKYKTRRKRRSEELDGFVVSSDDDVDMETVTQDDMSPTEAENHVGGDLKSMIRGSNGTSASQPRKMNCVLLSGPSGCGKTAAAYAVAQELGFDVFEIGPGSRRSGKDVLDRVGDLARNHQVRRRETITDTPLLDDGDDPHDEQQQSLTAFFNPASKPKRGRPSKKIAVPASGAGEAKKQQAQRKQALILLEEVDVLFEDDKQFWETVSDLAQQSRRPIIMTCNNETLLPMESLSLHAILRFKPVPDELAAVYLLLVAAAEGHLLAYEAVDALYKSKGSDLRATLAELQLRCQMGVGDDKGGLNWYLKRWPPGCDVDENGDVLHVVSSDTFARGMGFLPYRLGDEQARMEDIILQASSAHDVDPTILAETALEQSTSSSADQDGALTPSDNYAYLVDYSGWLDNLSAVDILSRVDVPVQDMVSLYRLIPT